MKICFLAGASSIHTVRWANAIADLGHEMSLITMHPAELDNLDGRVRVYNLQITNRIGYYLNVLEVKRLLRKIQPDLLNVHYASGYGTLSRLTGFSPTLLSVWGSDVYLYPYRSKKNQKKLEKNLKAADQIASTSIAMKEQTKLFLDSPIPIELTPFGIDLEKFVPLRKKKEDYIVIGTVKQLKAIYGIDILINATAKLLEQLCNKGRFDLAEKIQLKVVGSGSELEKLQQLVEDLNLTNVTEFIGSIPNSEVPKYLNLFDIYCAFSHSESFGVAVIEASACELPVVVSNVGGLPEVVKDGETGFVVDHQNIDEIVEYLLELVVDKGRRHEMGSNGRKFVEKSYDWNQNVLQMEKVYQKLIDRQKSKLKELK